MSVMSLKRWRPEQKSMFISAAARSSVSMAKWLMLSYPSSGRSVSEALAAAAILQTHTHTHINFFKIRLKVYITFHTAGCERLGLVEKNRDIMSHFIVSCLHRMFVEGLKFCYKFLTKIFIIQMNANVSNEFNVY